MSNTPITRDDLEVKLREVQSNVEQRTQSAKSTLIPAGIVGGILVLLLVYFVGKRVGTKRSTIVEIRRI
ncbi:MAG: hypothetical protein OEW42_00915 [Acidimicrobiia bacterium]|nr:hypothetical protein [Acidimicrobiia bacterium]MDH5236464.1 hypothetical protein [Acidimicrobiia bacterium]